jgi:protein TonB
MAPTAGTRYGVPRLRPNSLRILAALAPLAVLACAPHASTVAAPIAAPSAPAPAPAATASAPPEPPVEDAPPPKEAAKILTAGEDDADADSPVDFVVGTADTYAGGVTSGAIAPGGATGPAPSTSAGAGTSAATSSTPAVASPVTTDWKCAFPPEADPAQIDEATVLIQVHVRADGTPDRVDVLSDPGHGFGRVARACALKVRYRAARDAAGTPVPATTKPIRIHYLR